MSGPPGGEIRKLRSGTGRQRWKGETKMALSSRCRRIDLGRPASLDGDHYCRCTTENTQGDFGYGCCWREVVSIDRSLARRARPASSRLQKTMKKTTMASFRDLRGTQE